MYNSIGINRQKELNYLGKRVKIPKISDKSNYCCEHDHFNNDYSYSEHQDNCSSNKFDIKEDMDKMFCPVRDFMMDNKKIISIVAGALLITLGGIKLIKELS